MASSEAMQAVSDLHLSLTTSTTKQPCTSTEAFETQKGFNHRSPPGCSWVEAEEKSGVAAGCCVCSFRVSEERLGAQGKGGEHSLQGNSHKFKSKSVYVPSAAESQSATSAESDHGTM